VLRLSPEHRSVLRWTLGSAAAWGGLFLGVASMRAAGVVDSLLDVWTPILALSLIGFTVGGLTGPLLRRIWLRLRGPSRRDTSGP